MYQVLLVDDEPIILSGIKFLINWEMFDCNIVGTARNGQQALEAFDKLHPDIVICDISMPVLSGIEVLKKQMNPILKLFLLCSPTIVSLIWPESPCA